MKPFQRRLVILNVEQGADNAQYRIYPHLGLLYVGTMAKREGWDVVLWDELVQGRADLAKLLQPGDVLGLSLVVTGIERGIELARQARRFGVNAVIAGNDYAIFRSNQILRLPDRPIDAVFTSNSLGTQRTFFRNYNGSNLPQIAQVVPDIQIQPGGAQRSNARPQLLVELQVRKQQKTLGTYDPEDLFTVPDFSLFSDEYWKYTWNNYRAKYGNKYPDEIQASLKSAICLLASGCTRTGGADACSYCTIAGIGDVRIPSEQYLAATLEAYQKFGVTSFYNATDSAFEMLPLVRKLEAIGARFPSLQIYGRAQGISKQPELLDRWLSLVGHRLLLNVGMDSGDERILSQGVVKTSLMKGSRVEENKQAIHNIKVTGAHLHYSIIFGSPGESRESCERTFEFIQWSVDVLGRQLDLVETDYYWLNFGAPASQVFTDYTYAQKLAAGVGKIISYENWQRDFGQQAEEIIVPWRSEKAWYENFTTIDVSIASDYNNRVRTYVEAHLPGCITSLAFNPLLTFNT